MRDRKRYGRASCSPGVTLSPPDLDGRRAPHTNGESPSGNSRETAENGNREIVCSPSCSSRQRMAGITIGDSNKTRRPTVCIPLARAGIASVCQRRHNLYTPEVCKRGHAKEVRAPDSDLLFKNSDGSE
jgi:hypothetical protein